MSSGHEPQLIQTDPVNYAVASNLNLRLSDDAATVLRSTADELGCSVTALIEAVGLALAASNTIHASRLGELARQVDRVRRQRPQRVKQA